MYPFAGFAIARRSPMVLADVFTPFFYHVYLNVPRGVGDIGKETPHDSAIAPANRFQIVHRLFELQPIRHAASASPPQSRPAIPHVRKSHRAAGR